MHPAAATVVGTGLAGASAVLYGSLVERNAFVLRRFVLPVLPAGSRPVKVLHLSDLHLMPNQRRKASWVEALAEVEPDAVVNTGDNIAHPRSIEPLMQALEPFRRLPGAFVLGSNDYFAPAARNPTDYLRRKRPNPTSERLPTEELTAELARDGWSDLTNRRARMHVAGLDLELVGVDDPHLDYDRYEEVAGPADPTADLTVGIVHAPYTRVLDAMVSDGAGLLIAGHTHGGQLAVPFYGAIVTNCDLDTGRVKGVSRWWPGANGIPSEEAPDDAAWMHVSAGLGTSPYVPIRFACRPEASLLTLVPRA